MDFQHRAGGKTGSGGVASSSEANRDRRERLRQLALETIDLNKDPYFMKNHLGTYECRLCLTLHNNEGSYLAHTQGKKHQASLARRAARNAQENVNILPATKVPRVETKKFVKIGRPGYKVSKIRDPESNALGLLFQIDYPEIVEFITPLHRFMSAYEQKVEAPDKSWQYLLFAAEPYETIAFKVPAKEVDKSVGKFWTKWNADIKQFYLQFIYRSEKAKELESLFPNFQQNAFPMTPVFTPTAPPIFNPPRLPPLSQVQGMSPSHQQQQMSFAAQSPQGGRIITLPPPPPSMPLQPPPKPPTFN